MKFISYLNYISYNLFIRNFLKKYREYFLRNKHVFICKNINWARWPCQLAVLGRFMGPVHKGLYRGSPIIELSGLKSIRLIYWYMTGPNMTLPRTKYNAAQFMFSPLLIEAWNSTGPSSFGPHHIKRKIEEKVHLLFMESGHRKRRPLDRPPSHDDRLIKGLENFSILFFHSFFITTPQS